MADRHHVVILGGGFAGLYAARALRRAPCDVTLVDRRNFHLFQPLLYQVATGGLSPANIAAPLRAILKRQRNTTVLLATATGVDVAARRLVLADGALAYDTLLVATGASHSYFGRDEWAEHAPGLKTIEDATEIRRRVLLAFERAERSGDQAERAALLTFAVVGAGPTGVELSGALSEIARTTLRRDFRRIDPRRARVVLVEGAPRALPAYPAELSARAATQLAAHGVELWLGAKVVAIDGTGVTIERGGTTERLLARTVLWAAGVQASPIGRELERAAGAVLDRQGRVQVNADLTLPGHPEILVLGDLARLEVAPGQPLPGLAPVAMQMGRYAAQVVTRRLRGSLPPPPFRYSDRGTMATIGRAAAVAEVRGLRASGFFAWLLWLFVHLMYLVQFDNRVLVLFQWAWGYCTRNRSARLITGEASRTPAELAPTPIQPPSASL